MKKIYLFCNQGMSTSMLASRMQEVADRHRLPFEVKAFPHNKLRTIIEEQHPNCILLGPQVKYLYEETRETYKELRIPIIPIETEDYGLMDGEKVLKSVVIEMKKFKQMRDNERED